MKKYIILSLILLLWAIPVLAANTHSIDLETGSSQALTITDGDQTGLTITGDITIEAWIKIESVSGDDGIVTKYDYGAAERGYSIVVNNDRKIKADISDDGSSSAGHLVTILGSTVLDLDTWYHVALTFVPSTEVGKIYINGVDDSASKNGSMGATINDTTSNFSIGSYMSSGVIADSFDGLIDEVRVWSDVRTSTEISDNYQTELTGSEDNLVGYWKVNDSLLDETSNDNDLTNVNSAVFVTDVPFTAAAEETRPAQMIIFD